MRIHCSVSQLHSKISYREMQWRILICVIMLLNLLDIPLNSEVMKMKIITIALY